MDHTFANETYAAERYLLGEMQPEERDAFEEHFFSCKACGEDIQTSSIFVENAKIVFRGEAGKGKSFAKLSWLKKDRLKFWRLQVAVPAFAALAMAGVVVYQDEVTIPALKAPQSMASPMILDGETRAGLPRIESGRPLRFQMMLPRMPDGDHVMVEVVKADGGTMRRGSVEAPDYDRPLDVYFPGRLAPGRYALIARGTRGENTGVELGRDAFEVTEPLNIPFETVTPRSTRKGGSGQ